MAALSMLLLFAGSSSAQLISPALKQATSVDAAFAIIGIKSPELSTFLLLDMPEVALAGKVRVNVASELAGTSWLLLLRGRAGVPQQALPGQIPLPALLGAWPFKAGGLARASLDVDVHGTETFTLLAYTRGRWFSVERQVKLGMPLGAVQAAKDARARRVKEIMARPVGATGSPSPQGATPATHSPSESVPIGASASSPSVSAVVSGTAASSPSVQR